MKTYGLVAVVGEIEALKGMKLPEGAVYVLQEVEHARLADRSYVASICLGIELSVHKWAKWAAAKLDPNHIHEFQTVGSNTWCKGCGAREALFSVPDSGL